MQRYHSLFAGLLLLGATNAQSQSGQNLPTVGGTSLYNTHRPSLPALKPVTRDFSRLPLSFESNQGQTNPQVRFLSHAGENTLFLTSSEAVFSLIMPTPSHKENSTVKQDRKPRRSAEKSIGVALRMQMVGANPRATTLEQQPLEGRVNYFLGQDRSKWHAGVPTFGRVGFHGVYPGVDLVYYGNRKHLEYDFLVAPHADPKQIHLHFAGAQRVWVNATGDLSVRAQGQELRWQKPRVYQQDTAGKHPVPARFQLTQLPNGKTGVGFALGRYDTNRPLVIDPVLTYSTYLNGFSNFFSSGTTGIAVDSDGNVYMAGNVANADFPTSPGAFQISPPNTKAAFVSKINPTGTALVYSTFLGGSMGFDSASCITVDKAGNAYVAGITQSPDFPVTPGAFQPTKGSNTLFVDTGFVTKINPTGTGLVYSTYLGGLLRSDISGIAVDEQGAAYVCGYTASTDFPVTSDAFQKVNKTKGPNGSNAFVTKLNPTGTALVYSTYLGGTGPVSNPNTGSDVAGAIVVDGAGTAYVTGKTNSPDFPITPGTFQTVNHGGTLGNAFVTRLNATGSGLIYSTFLGGSTGGDAGYRIAIDSAGNAYIAGSTPSLDFPTTQGAFQATPPPTIRVSTAFVSKVDPTGATLVYSTYLGGTNASVASDLSTGDGFGIAVDTLGNAYVVGRTGCDDFPTTPGAFQRAPKSVGFYNPFLTKLNAAGTAPLYSTYLGGTGKIANGDFADGVAVDKLGNAYITGTTFSHDFPTTPGAFQRTAPMSGANGASFVTKLSAIPIFPDFNNDGSTDLFLQNASTGVIASWFMQGSTWTGGAYFSLTPPIEYALVGAGDFSGNGATTLVLQSRNTNQVAFWYTSGANNATIPSGNFVNTTPAAGWKVVGVGDFNGDGKSDLVFQNQTTNQVIIWFMNGSLYQGGVLLPFTPLAGWKVVGTGDLNADGFPDLIFQNQSTDQIALWYMKGSTYIGGAVMSNVPGANWKVVGVGDYNGDSYTDLLFQNQTTNSAMVWYLKGGVFQTMENLSLNPPAGWQIVGPR